MTYKLFLDDQRNPSDVTWINIHHDDRDWVVVRSYHEFVAHIETYGLPDYIAFDHDLAEEHYWNDLAYEHTGMHCAKWLVAFCQDRNLKIPRYDVHSMNPVGRLNIVGYLESAKRTLGL